MEAGRHPRPRADGRRRGGRQGGHEAQEGRPRRRPVHASPAATCLFCQKQLFSLLRHLQPERRDRRARRWATRRPGCSATRTCSAASPAARPSTCACRSPTSARSRSPDGLPDEKVLFLSDIFPTGYMAAENARDRAGRHGRGLGLRAGRPVRHPERLDARGRPGRSPSTACPSGCRWPRSTARPRRSTSTRRTSTTRLMEMTKGRGPDRCIDAVGCEAHATGSVDAVLDKAKTAVGAGHRPGARAARGDHVLPQGRHDLDPRRLRRLPGQDPVRRR